MDLQGLRLYLVLCAIAFAAFLVSLDGFIVNVAIPSIAGELGVRSDMGTWMITVFSTTSTIFIAFSGYVARRIGHLKLFVFALLLFLFSSLMVGLSPNFSMLLFFRTVQGASAGLVTPVSLALIIQNFPEAKRAVAIGFWSFFVMVGPAMGPMIGGWLANYHWPWMFFLNIPICLFSLVTILLLLHENKPVKTSRSLDLFGMVLLFTAIAAIQSATNRWNIDDWFRSGFIISLFILAAFALICFIGWELFHPAPFMDLRLLKKRNFVLPSLTSGFGMGMLFSSFVLDSLWVQEVLGYTPAWAGLTLTPVGIFPMIVYPVIGRFIPRFDIRIWVIASFIFYAMTFFWLSRINIYTSFWDIALPRLVQGIGFAAFTVPNAILSIQGVERERLTNVISFYSFIRTLFVGIGVALAITLWTVRETFYQSRMAGRTTERLLEQLIAPFNALNTSPEMNYALGYEEVVNTASTLGLADIYYLYGWFFIALCFLVLFYKPVKPKACQVVAESV